MHPSTTTRAPSSEQVQAADDALFYLDHVNALVGPANAKFSTAFQFSSASTSRPGRRRARFKHDVTQDAGEEHGKVHIGMANNGSLWNRVEDFWCVVGWAFNCSVRHSKRWDRWKLWLAFMLDVLEDDLEICLAAAERVKSEEDGQAGSDSVLAEPLIAQYLAQIGDDRAGKRRVMRAILADGSKKSLAEFGEIWKSETRERDPPTGDHISKRQRLDFDKGEFGDYMDMDEEDDENQDTAPDSISSKRRSTRNRLQSQDPTTDDESAPADEDVSKDFGGVDSVLLRQRFMALVS